MGTEGLSVADAMALANNEGAFGGNGAWVFFLFFLLAWGGNGFWGNRGGGQPATTDDIQNQFNFSALERQNNETVAAVRQAAYDVTGAVKDMGYMNSNQIRDIESQVQGINAEINAVRYDNSINTRDLLASNCEQTQKILDAISCNRMADMQNQINQLQLQAALAGVVRYPLATTYTMGANPYCGCGCGTYN